MASSAKLRNRWERDRAGWIFGRSDTFRLVGYDFRTDGSFSIHAATCPIGGISALVVFIILGKDR